MRRFEQHLQEPETAPLQRVHRTLGRRVHDLVGLQARDGDIDRPRIDQRLDHLNARRVRPLHNVLAHAQHRARDLDVPRNPFHRVVALHCRLHALEEARRPERLVGVRPGRRVQRHPVNQPRRSDDDSLRLLVDLGAHELEELQGERRVLVGRLGVLAVVRAAREEIAEPFLLVHAGRRQDGCDSL